MAAPQFVQVPPFDSSRSYSSPAHVPAGWSGGRAGELNGRQPRGTRLGHQGPDQGYALVLARRCTPKLQLQPGEHAADTVQGCLGIALRRASLFGRAPLIHDFTVAFTLWGFYDPDPPTELVATRQSMFTGVEHVEHRYEQARAIVDRVPEATLRMSHQAVEAAYPTRWKELISAVSAAR